MRKLSVNQVKVAYEKTQILDGISLQLSSGEIGCLLGPSGCGKTTLLRSIAGLQSINNGQINLGKSLISSRKMSVPTEKRNIGMVFQDYALFPHMNIADNICYGIKKQSKTKKIQRVKELLALVGLPLIEQRYPHELSGGQQQRVALARALAPKPDILLLDEPFSGLDVELRESLAKEVREILKTEGITALMVTHNQNEAFAIADSVGVMNKGQLLQWATPYKIYHEPADPFVADFIGQGMLIQGAICDCIGINTELGLLKTQLPANTTKGQKVSVLVRPDDVVHDDASKWQLEVVDRSFRGSHFLFTVKLANGELIQCMSQSHHDHPVGSKIGVRLEMDHAVIFPLICNWKGQELC